MHSFRGGRGYTFFLPSEATLNFADPVELLESSSEQLFTVVVPIISIVVLLL